jgi:FlaA1/EpsC-like NDP-sugar epimerase
MKIEDIYHKVLGRETSLFSEDLRNYAGELEKSISGKSVLVIGGAGTIGASFIKAVLKFRPEKLVVIDVNENGLTELVRNLRSTAGQYVPSQFYTYPLSFDNPVFEKLFRALGPFHIVANFAAHKHVRSEKDIYSIEALLDNNIIKAKGLLDLLEQHPPEHFFCVSTDKAANPVNIMGASKKIMEELILTFSTSFKVSTARFANVAFSNGSLLDGFLKRIERQQPLSCPSDVKRFFVSPDESGEICLIACILGKTGEIFFPKLDMVGSLIKFADILPVVLDSFGYEPYYCASEEEARTSMHLVQENKYPVYIFKSDTSGEKLFEEFYTEDETYDLQKFDTLGVIRKTPVFDGIQFTFIIAELKALLATERTTKSDIVAWLTKYIPEFNHIETGLSLDQKM